jgi:hypothetical protein
VEEPRQCKERSRHTDSTVLAFERLFHRLCIFRISDHALPLGRSAPGTFPQKQEQCHLCLRDVRYLVTSVGTFQSLFYNATSVACVRTTNPNRTIHFAERHLPRIAAGFALQTHFNVTPEEFICGKLAFGRLIFSRGIIGCFVPGQLAGQAIIVS